MQITTEFESPKGAKANQLYHHNKNVYYSKIWGELQLWHPRGNYLSLADFQVPRGPHVDCIPMIQPHVRTEWAVLDPNVCGCG